MKSKKLEALNRLDKERQTKKLLGEEAEKIDAMGQENERKAAKWVIEEGKQNQQVEDKIEAEEIEKLESKGKKGQLFGYADEIVQATIRRMREFDKPQGFDWGVYKTKNGRGIEIRYMRPDKRVFARGMDVSFSPNHDVNWIIRTIHKALDEMEAYDELLHPDQFAAKRDEIFIP